MKSFFESIEERPLRVFLKSIGIDEKRIEEKRSLKLLELIVKIINISVNTGLSIVVSPKEIISRVKFSEKSEEMSWIFYLNDIRNFVSHKPGEETKENYLRALEFFDINIAYMKTHGWGTAVDKIYDKIISAEKDISKLIKESIETL